MLAVQRRRLSPSPSRSPERIPIDNWKRGFSFIGATSVGHGGSGSVFAIDNARVIKVFSEDYEGQMDLARERAIYEKLQTGGRLSPYIVTFYEEWASGLVLERLDSTLRQHLAQLPQSMTPSHADQWIRESCKGLAFLHENGVLHSDIGCQNILLGTDNHTKLCDFAGSKIEDEDAWISYEVRSQHPGYIGKQPTEETEIFALGSVIFEIWTCRPPYASDPDSVVRKRFSARDFPLSFIEEVSVREIVETCWNGGNRSVAEVCEKFEKD
jgi:serine/threonine protein kinase